MDCQGQVSANLSRLHEQLDELHQRITSAEENNEPNDDPHQAGMVIRGK